MKILMSFTYLSAQSLNVTYAHDTTSGFNSHKEY